MSPLLDLAERCEKAAGPDRQLDADIHIGVTTFEPRRAGVGWPDENAPVVPAFPGWKLLPDYTASLDAAMTLVPEGWSRSDGQTVGFRAWANLWQDGKVPGVRTLGATPALALCAAALRARAAGEQS